MVVNEACSHFQMIVMQIIQMTIKSDIEQYILKSLSLFALAKPGVKGLSQNSCFAGLFLQAQTDETIKWCNLIRELLQAKYRKIIKIGV